ncbi:MAG: ribokinase [Planctomycetota bacterium]|jgi:ribokinase
MPDKPNILVVGSINMDLVVHSQRLPEPGETVLGSGFLASPGGKGANQAVAAARMGGNVHMIGRVGDDDFGRALLAKLNSEGVSCGGVSRDSDARTGVAMIIVDSLGENTIVVDSGANHEVSADDDIFPNLDLFEAADVVVLQLELPLPVVRSAIDQAKRHHCKIILDPAPVPRHLPPDLYKVDILTPNIVEARRLTEQTTEEERVDKIAALELIARGARAVAVKLGHRGTLLISDEGRFDRIGPYKVAVVDTTAAGDTYTGALATAVGQGKDLSEAAKIANAAGALACRQIGAQSAMPDEAEVRALMRDQPN